MKHSGPISGVAVFGNYVATAGYDNKVMLWDGRNKSALSRVSHDHLANYCDFSPNGQYLVSASSDYSARVWEIPSLRLKTVLNDHVDDVDIAVFSPKSNLIATGARGDFGIRIFDVDGNCHAKLLGHTDYITSLAWSWDQAIIVSSSDDGTVRRWDLHTGAELDRIDLSGIQTETVAIGRSGTLFAGDDLGRIIIVEDGASYFISAHHAGVKRIVLDDEKQLLATSSYDGSVIVWKIIGNGMLEKLGCTDFPSIVWPRSAAFWGESKLIFGTFGSSYAVFDYVNGTWEIEHIEADPSINAVCVVAGAIFTIGDAGILRKNGQIVSNLGSLCNFLLPFGKTLLTGGQLGIVFDALSGQAIYKHRSPINCGAVFSNKGCLFAAIGAYTGEALVFRSDDGSPVFSRSLNMHENAIKGLAADNLYLFSACSTAAVAFHDLGTFEEIKHIDNAHAEIANGCVGTSNGFASIGRDRKLRLWHRHGTRCFDTPHQNSIKCIATDDEKRLLATGGYRGMVAIFDLAQEIWIHISRPSACGISSICYDGTLRRFVASSYDGELHYFSVEMFRKPG